MAKMNELSPGQRTILYELKNNGAWIDERGRRYHVVYPDRQPNPDKTLQKRRITRDSFDKLKLLKHIKVRKDGPPNLMTSHPDWAQWVWMYASPGEVDAIFNDEVQKFIQLIKSEPCTYLSVAQGYRFADGTQIPLEIMKHLQKNDLVMTEGKTLRLVTEQDRIDRKARQDQATQEEQANKQARLRRWADMIRPFGATVGSNYTPEIFGILESIANEAMGLSTLNEPNPKAKE